MAEAVPCLTSLSHCLSLSLSLSSDEYKMKGVEEVKYMRGEEERLNARNQENTVRETERERPPDRVES